MAATTESLSKIRAVTMSSGIRAVTDYRVTNESHATESASEMGVLANQSCGTPSSEVGTTATSHEIRTVPRIS
jgi:hypothetical protein